MSLNLTTKQAQLAKARILGLCATLLMLAALMAHLPFVIARPRLVPLWLAVRKEVVLGSLYLVFFVVAAILLYFAFKNLDSSRLFTGYKRFWLVLLVACGAVYILAELNLSTHWLLGACALVWVYMCGAWVWLWIELGRSSQNTLFGIYALCFCVVASVIFAALIAMWLVSEYVWLYVLFLGEFSLVVSLLGLKFILLLAWVKFKR